MIEGVQITLLKRILHEKGDIYHAMKQSEDSFTSFGEAYFSSVHLNDIKGWKKHTKMVLNLVVPVGSVRFALFDDRSDSITNGELLDVTASSDNYIRLTVPAGIWVAFQGVGKDLNLLLNMASIEHDPLESISASLNSIPFRW
jgi:dTDP-4-dehydrorhamnose 3,5-epimerase